MNTTQFEKSKHKGLVKESFDACEALRRDVQQPVDITLGEYIQENYQLSLEALYTDLGVDPNSDTLQNLLNLPDKSLTWLVPEIVRDAIRLGLKKSPIYPNLIAQEISVNGTTIKTPAINPADATPRKVGIAETISLGSVSFQQKSVEIFKYGRGIKIPYEMKQYVSLNLVSIFLQDFGTKLGMGLDTLALDTLINGDQADGSDSAPIIGIATANSLVYKDLLRLWVRGDRLRKSYNQMVAGETTAVDVLEIMTNTRLQGEARVNIDIKTPLPQTANMYIHGRIPVNQLLILDKASALIKFNAQPLLVESEKIISNQTEETYATFTSGFGTIFRDSRLIMDTTLAFSSNGFPTWMDPTGFELTRFQ